MLVHSVPQSVPTSTQVASNCAPMIVDSRDQAPLPLSSPAQVVSGDPNPQSEVEFIGADEDDEDPYDASRQDVINAYSFVPPNLDPMPITSLNDLLYYHYGFSLSKSPYKCIPVKPGEKKSIHSWVEFVMPLGGNNFRLQQ